MARGGRTRYTVLGALTLGPRSGYDIKKFIEGSTNHFWRESFGQIYPALKELTSAGLVQPNSEDRSGKPDRTLYEITAAGRAELHRWLVAPAEADTPRNELLLKLFFGVEIPEQASIQHVECKRQDLHEELDAMEGILAWLDTERSDAPGYPFWRLTVRQGIMVNEALLAWCDEADRTIRSIAKGRSKRPGPRR